MGRQNPRELVSHSYQPDWFPVKTGIDTGYSTLPRIEQRDTVGLGENADWSAAAHIALDMDNGTRNP